MRARRGWRKVGVALTLLLAIPVLFRGLGLRDFENDEAIHAQVVEGAVRAGQWLELPNPYGGPFLEKPPLKFWALAALIRVGVVSPDERGMRLLDATLATLALVYLFLIGERIAGVVCGLGTVILLLGNERLVFEHGLRSHNLEAMLVLAYAGGMYHALVVLTGHGRRRSHALAVGFWFGFAFLAKLVAAAFLPVIVAAAVATDATVRHQVWQRRRDWLLAAAVASAMILPYIVTFGLHFGPRFAQEVIGQHILARFAGQLDPRHLQPLDYYWARAWAGLAEAHGLFVVGAVAFLWRAIRSGWIEGRLVCLWFLIPTVALSWPVAKLGHYLYPFLPPLAMIAAYPIARLVTWAGEADRARDHRPRTLSRRLAMAVAIIATTVVVITAMGTPIVLPLGPWTLRATMPLRAAVVAVVALGFARTSLRSALALAGVLWLTAVGTEGWSRSLRLATRPQTMIRDLTACLARAGGSVYVHLPASLPLMNDVRWYFEHTLRVERSTRFAPAELDTRLEQGDAAIVVFDEEYTRLRSDTDDRPRRAPLPAHRLYNMFLLLPGPYAQCAVWVPHESLVPGEVRR